MSRPEDFRMTEITVTRGDAQTWPHSKRNIREL